MFFHFLVPKLKIFIEYLKDSYYLTKNIIIFFSKKIFIKICMGRDDLKSPARGQTFDPLLRSIGFSSRSPAAVLFSVIFLSMELVNVLKKFLLVKWALMGQKAIYPNFLVKIRLLELWDQFLGSRAHLNDLHKNNYIKN